MKNNFFRMTVALLLAVAVSGCSLFAPHTQTITINGQPEGAKVIVNGNVYVAPCMFEIKRNQSLNIIVTKKGYETYTNQSSFGLSTIGLVDVVGGAIWLVPFIGLVSPGAFAHSQNNFYYILEPVKK